MDHATQVTFHIGAPFTSASDLALSARANADVLRAHDSFAPPIRKARSAINDMIRRLDGLPPIPEEQADLFGQISGPGPTRHLFLSDDLRSGSLRDLFTGPALLNGVEVRLPPVAELFAPAEFRFAMSLINPAVFLQRAFASGTATRAIKTFAQAADPDALSWRNVILRLRRAMPDVPLTLWCDEDVPLIWPRVLRNLFALPAEVSLDKELAPLAPMLEPEGLSRLSTYLQKFPPETNAQYERVILLFLEKYGIEDALSPECDLPGWDEARIGDVTAQYEDDIAALAEDEGVTLLLPETPLA